MIDTPEQQHTPADRAFVAAIESDIAGEKLYPDDATFIDAEAPGAGLAIAQAASEGRVVVLCSPDGTRQVLYPRAPAAG